MDQSGYGVDRRRGGAVEVEVVEYSTAKPAWSCYSTVISTHDFFENIEHRKIMKHSIKTDSSLLGWAFFWLIVIPVGLSIFLTETPSTDDVFNARRFAENRWALTIGPLLVIGGALVGSVAFRRTLSIDGSACILKHSWYTQRLDRSDVERIEVNSNLNDYLEDVIAIKTNGMKLGSYWSGFFSGKSSSRYFCAVASATGVVIHLRNPIKRCNIIVVSVDDEVAKLVKNWAVADL